MKMSYTNHKTLLSILLSLLAILSIQITSFANTDPVFTDGNSTDRKVRENTDADENIGDPVSATDEDDDTLTYTLGGTDADSFDIDSDTGQLKTAEALDYETTTEYSVTVSVSDGNGGEDSIDVTIDVKDVVDLSTPLSERTRQVRQAIVHAISGVRNPNDAGDSHLEGITGLNISNRNIESLQSGDFGGLTRLEIITVSRNSLTSLPEDVFEGLSSLEHLLLNDNSISSLPSGIFEGLSSVEQINLKNNSLTSLPEDIFEGLSSLKTINLIWNSISSLPPDIFDGLSSLRTLYLRSNSISSLPDELFSGLTALRELNLSYNSSPAPSIPVSLSKVADGEFKATVRTAAPFNINLPVVATNGSIDDDATTIRISRGETESDDSLTVTRTAGVFAAVTVNIGDALPSIPKRHSGYRLTRSDDLPLEVSPYIERRPVFTDGSSATRSVPENTAADENIGEPVSATPYDTDGTLTYTLGGTDVDSFGIDSESGQLKTEAALDYETATAYDVTVTATDENDFARTIDVTINVTDVNERPRFSEDSTTRWVDENTARGENIGEPIVGTDPDADATLTYSIGGTDVSKFRIGSNGQLMTHAELDYEKRTTYSVTVGVSDGRWSHRDTIDVTINVNDLFDESTPLSDRTSEITDAIVDALSDVNSSDDVTDADLTTITSLTLSGEVESLQNGDFSGLSALEVLKLDDNSITQLPGNVFRGLSALTTLDLSSNSIEELPGNVFRGLSALTDLDLSSNSIEELPGSVFDNLSALTDLDLSSNSIEDISWVVFSDLSALTDLDLSSNSLTRTAYGLFDDLSALKTLDLSSNSITLLTLDMIEGSPALETLDLSSNRLTGLPTNAFRGGSRVIKELDVSSNNLTWLPADVFKDWSALETLDLSSNSIEDLPGNVFRDLSALQTLDLSENSLSSLPDSIFVGLSDIRIIDASDNTVDPLIMKVKLEKSTDSEGNNGFKAVVESGTTYRMQIGVTITNGTGFFKNDTHESEGELVTVFFETGVKKSVHVEVTPTPGTTSAVTAQITTLTTLRPTDHSGYQPTIDDETIEVYAAQNEGNAPSNVQQIPDTTAFLPNFPNPFNPETWIPYQLSTPADVTLRIYNVRGVMVRKLALGHQPAGYYTNRSRAAYWDGRNGVGEKVAGGIYFCTFKAGEFTATRKLLILK